MSEVYNGEIIPVKNRPELNISESLKLKKNNKEFNHYNLNNNNNTSSNNKNNNTNMDSFQDVLDIPAQITQEKIRQKEEKEKILNYIKESQYIIDTDHYSNSIIIGSFCYAMAFVSFGIYKSRIISDEYTNIWTCLATYGGLGQLTAGFLELNKKREFTSFLYLIYGTYCLTHYLLRILTDRFGEYDLCMFFLAFFLLSVPAIIFSIKINLFFLLQTSLGSLYFLMRCIGEGIFEDILSEQVSGSIQIASGVCSFYIFIYQIYNSFDFRICLPIIPFDVNNGIDFIIQKNVDKSHSN
jgi:succinate-acetate transporter protein